MRGGMSSAVIKLVLVVVWVAVGGGVGAWGQIGTPPTAGGDRYTCLSIGLLVFMSVGFHSVTVTRLVHSAGDGGVPILDPVVTHFLHTLTSNAFPLFNVSAEYLPFHPLTDGSYSVTSHFISITTPFTC